MSLNSLLCGRSASGFKASLTVMKAGKNPNVINMPCIPHESELTMDSEEQIAVIGIPSGSILYKAMTIPSGVATDSDLHSKLAQNKILSKFANSTSWYSVYSIAKAYADSAWGKQQNYKLVEFETVRPLKLFFLYSVHNLELLISKIDEKIQAIRTEGRLKEYFMSQINELLIRREIVQLATGLGVTYEEQLALVRKWGRIFTNDANYDPTMELIQRAKYWPKHSSVNEIYFSAENGEPSVVNFAGFGYVGPERGQLNRVSFTTELDRYMSETIGMFFNVDGYYAPQVPSLFHRDGNLPEEIAILTPRSSVKVLQFNTIKPIVPVFQYGRRRPSKTSSVALKRKKSIVRGSTIQFTPFSFRTITCSSATGVPAKRRKVVKRKRRV